MIPAKLVLETGEVFSGVSPEWQANQVFGEVVFNTGMVGYVETLTDPSYKGQMLCFTYPLIGNYGVPNKETWESDQIQASAMIVANLATFHSRTTAEHSLLEWFEAENVPFIANVDTRALTKCLRDKGVVAGAIITDDKIPAAFPDINQANLVKAASIEFPIEYGSGDKKLILIDCGMKSSMLHLLRQFPMQIKRVPYDYNFLDEDFDAVFVSNGPGDPATCHETIAILKQALELKKPIFGICLGSQLMGLAAGASTYKLRFGHRSQNQPCLHEATGRCVLTSQNHGYAIAEDSLPAGWKVSYRNLNDATVQGIEHESLPYSSVQFHPEAHPGPVDTISLFEDFYQRIVT